MAVFSPEGHISKWVFVPAAWCGSTEYWADGWDLETRGLLFSHLRACVQCRRLEAEIMLRYMEKPVRRLNQELIYLNPEEHANHAYEEALKVFPEMDAFIQLAVSKLNITDLEDIDFSCLPEMLSRQLFTRFMSLSK